MNDTITLVDGVRVGHCHDSGRLTGVSVVVLDEGCVVGVDVRGGAPGTYDVAGFGLGALRDSVDAVFISGGSAFGLDVAGGVKKALIEMGRGFEIPSGRLPLVAGGIIYDLGVAKGLPDSEMGYLACRNAGSGPVEMGSVGAGIGATVGKMLGLEYCMRGGLGSYAFRLPGGVVVGALVVVNCFGNVFDLETGRVLAGVRRRDGKGFVEVHDVIGMLSGAGGFGIVSLNTTVGVVATNVRLNRSEVARVAVMSHDGLARAIRPVHTFLDGDVMFAVSTGKVDLPEIPGLGGEKSPFKRLDGRSYLVSLIGEVAAEAVRRSVLRAVLKAKSIKGIPSASDYP